MCKEVINCSMQGSTPSPSQLTYWRLMCQKWTFEYLSTDVPSMLCSVWAPGHNAPWFDFWFQSYIYYLLVYIIHFLTYPFFFTFLGTYLLPYLSFHLRIDLLCFQAGCRKRRLNLALVFCVVVHFSWLVNACFRCFRFSFFPYQAKRSAWGNVSENVLSGTWNHNSISQSAIHVAHCVFVGITFTEKWNTDNMLATEVTVEDQLLKGLKLSFDTQFVPQTGWVCNTFVILFIYSQVHSLSLLPVS